MRRLLATGTLLLAVLLWLVTAPAGAETIDWYGYTFDVNGATASINTSGNLQVSADGTIISNSGKITGGALLTETDYYTAGTVNSFEATFLDDLNTNTGTWVTVKTEYPDLTTAFLMVGAPLGSSAYVAFWGVREAWAPESANISAQNAGIAPRSAGEHTAKIVLNPDGSSQFWLDGTRAFDQTDVLIDKFQGMTLVNQASTAGSTYSTFTSVAVGTSSGSAPEPGTILLLGTGLSVVALWRRRSKRKCEA